MTLYVLINTTVTVHTWQLQPPRQKRHVPNFNKASKRCTPSLPPPYGLVFTNFSCSVYTSTEKCDINSVKSSRDVTCTLLSLLPLFVYFFLVLPSLLHPSILLYCFLCLFLFLFCYPWVSKHMHCLWATPPLGSILACLRSFMLSFSNI